MKVTHLIGTLLLLALIILIAALNAHVTSTSPMLGLALGLMGIAVLLFCAVGNRLRNRSPAAGLPGDRSDRRMHPILKICLIIFAAAVASAAIAIPLDCGEAVLLSWALLIAILLGIACLYLIYLLCTSWTRRRTTDRIVIGQIATVVRQNLPLATGLALAAESEGGAARRNLQRVSQMLAQGASLSEAIELGFPDCPSIPLSLIMAGEKTTQLPLAIEQAEQYLIDRARRRDRVDISVWPYILIVNGFMFLVVAGIMVAVIPKFKEIFKDFGTELPGLTLWLMSVCEFMLDTGLLAVLGIALVIGVPVGIYLNLRPRRLRQLASTSRWADWIRWHVPGWRSMEFSAGMATVLRTIQLGVRAGMNLEPAVRLAAHIDVNSQLRPRVTQFADLLASGTNVRTAARQAGLGDVTAIALSAGQRSSDLDAGLRYAADYNDALTNRFWIVLRNLAWPLTTLIMGVLVGTVVVALFLPLVKLINSVASGA